MQVQLYVGIDLRGRGNGLISSDDDNFNEYGCRKKMGWDGNDKRRRDEETKKRKNEESDGAIRDMT